MTKMLDCVNKLAREIGARPVGTDEEQQAALFIEDEFNRNTNFKAEVQEFNAVRNPELARVVPAGITFLGCVLAFALPSVPAIPLLLTLAGVALFACNELGIFSLAQFLGKAPSQNVVAIRKPAVVGDSRKKIVILTNYDNEKTRAEEASGLFAQLGHIKMFELGALALAFLGCLISFFAGSNFFVTILLVLGIIGSLLPIVALIIHSTGKFNEGANNNAASVAVMLDVASRISAGVYAPHGETPIIHGVSAAQEAGAIPQDVPVSWETSPVDAANASAQVESMFFSKKRSNVENSAPVEDRPQGEPVIIQQPENQQPQEVDRQQVVTYAEPPAPVPAATSAPDWFTRGKEKAGDKGNTMAGSVKRSTFGDAFVQAEQVIESAQPPKSDENDLQKKLQAIHDQIESSSANATENAQKDAVAAEKVLNNEAKQQQTGVQGYLQKETSAPDFEASTAVEVEQKRTAASVVEKPEARKAAVSEVPALKPLEPEYGVEVDAADFLDKSKTAPMEAVERPPQETPAPAPAPKRDIALPSLTGALESKKINERLEKEKKAEEREHNVQAQSKLSINLPSLSADVAASKAEASENKAVSNVSAFGVGEATGTFAPITDEDLRRANKGEEDMYVYDADDSALQQATTDSGAVAGPGYVDIPDTHTESIFGKLFHKKDKGADDSFASSIGVDENYEARNVGKHRGDWSSFENDAWDDDDWNGGAVVVAENASGQAEVMNERDEIYNFATGDITCEVWCVALGAEVSNHSGLQNFLATNGADLKGARFITLDAMGAGNISIVEREGVFKPQSIQTRMKRFARDAAKLVGISSKGEKMLWKETTSSKLGAAGHKYIHIAGFEGGKPALLSTEKDTVEAIDPETLQKSADFVMELVRTL